MRDCQEMKNRMTITVPLELQKEAKLIAVAESMGVTAHELVSQAINKIISEAPEPTIDKEPTISLRGLLVKYGTAPLNRTILSDLSGTPRFGVPCD